MDTGSDLYATVGDKVAEKPQGRSRKSLAMTLSVFCLTDIALSKTATSSLKKQISVSQHSSISQADDLSSPYARVRSPPHAYDKVRPAEHPYAQVKASGVTNTTTSPLLPGGPSTSQVIAENVVDESSISRRGSHQSLLDAVDGQPVIPAASAIAGRVSASQELPYMTPPIVQPTQQHFSGDSQDSSSEFSI